MISFGEWVRDAEPTAYGILRLLPWDFGRMTPGEFGAACRGKEQEQRAQYGLAAWAVANLINHALGPKKPIQPCDLMKSLDPDPKPMKRNLREDHERILKRFGRKK